MTTRLGQYELLEKFAEGGMAEVWFGRVVGAEGFLREVAVKRLLPASARDPAQVAMFLDEARLGAMLHHPHIVSVLDLGGGASVGAAVPSEQGPPQDAAVEDPAAHQLAGRSGEWFMVMELVDGPHLGRLFAQSLRIGKPLPEPLCAAVVAAAAEGLHHAHERVDPVTGESLAIVHRDISPQNVLISRHGDVKITDFGVARARSHRSRTRSGVVKGKLGYLSPEQCRGTPVDRRSDVFSLGIVLYELLSRQRLYRGDGEFDVMQRICEQEPLPPGMVFDGVDPTLGEIALRALRKEPAARFQSAGELGDALLAWLQAKGVGDSRHQLGWWVRNHTAPIWMPLEQRMLRWAERDAQLGQPVLVDRTRTEVAMQRLPRALPPEPDVFVGRRSELEAIGARLDGEVRLLTLRGVPGVGKSRLAQRVLRLRASGGRAVLRIDLASVDGELGLVSALTQALGLAVCADLEAGQIAIEHALARVGDALLLLDDADGVRSALARLLPACVERAPKLRLIVTARRALRCAHEQVLDVAPMSTPEGDDLSGSEAVALLLARAREVRPGFRLGPGQQAATAALVRRLDGLPLALELAAARLDVLEPDALLQRLDQDSDALRGSGRRGDTGLRDVFASALCDLPPDLLRLLARATVFCAAFDLAAAERVLAADPSERRDLLAGLDALRERSLLRMRDDGDGAMRFALLTSLREVAADALDAADGAATRARREVWLRDACLDLLERVDRLGGADAMRRLEQLREELEVAAATPTRAVFVQAWAQVRLRRGPLQGVAERLEQAMVRFGHDAPALGLLLADLNVASGDLAAARRALTQVLTSPIEAPAALGRLASVALRQSRPDEALAAADRGLDRLRSQGSARGAGALLLVRAQALDALGQGAGADRVLEQAIEALRADGDASQLITALTVSARRALDRGLPAAAGPLAIEAVEIAERAGDAKGTLRARLVLAAGALQDDRAQEAEATLERCEATGAAAQDAELSSDLQWLRLVADLRAGRRGRRTADRATEAAATTGDRQHVARAALFACAAALAEGDAALAERELDTAEGWTADRPADRAWIAALAARLTALGTAPAPQSKSVVPAPPDPDPAGIGFALHLLRQVLLQLDAARRSGDDR